MKVRCRSFVAGAVLGAFIFGGSAAWAAGILAERSTNRIFVNGKEVRMEAYQINGANYVKLRDVGNAVGFEVGYDAATNSVYIGEQPQKAQSGVIALPTDGSKYVPRVGDIIRCEDGYLYEIKDTLRWENNVFEPGPLPELPTPTYDWSVFPMAELPEPEARHFSNSTGEELFIRNIYETRRMQYTIYEALKNEPEAWRDGKPLAKTSLTIPAEDEPYTKYFWPWRATEVTKHVRAFPSFHFRVEAWDYFHNGIFEETRYYIDIT